MAGAPVLLTGYERLDSGEAGGEQTGVLIETFVGGLGALIVLGWVFGSFLAIVPLLMAVVAILTTFLVIWGVTTVADVSFIVQFVVSLIGLGVAMDYALLIVTRWKEERVAGLENEAAVRRSMETAGSAVVFSGLTVGVGLLSLVVLPVPFLRSIGYGGMLIPLVSVLVATTLLPVVLATVGPRLDWPRWAAFVVRRRWLAAGVGVAILAVLLVPATTLRVGDADAESLARSGEAADGFHELTDAGIGAGVLLPYEVLTQGADPAAVAATLAEVEGVEAAVSPDGDGWRRGDNAVVAVYPTADGTSEAGLATLERVRDAAGGWTERSESVGWPRRTPISSTRCTATFRRWWG